MRSLPVFMYHHVSPASGLVTVSPPTFRDQIASLARQGWRSIGTAELEACLAGQPLPPKSLMITFDDGYLDNWLYAHPVLQEFGMSAVLFVVTGWLGDGPARMAAESPDHRECKRRIAAGEADSVILRWSEVEAMQKAGTFEFHSHTHTHTRWDRELPDNKARLDAMAEEFQLSRQTLNERLGLTDRHLCWPQGYYQDDYIPLARAAGFDYLYTTEAGTNPPGGDANRIKRIVTKEKSGQWAVSRARIHSSTWLSRIYGMAKK